MSDNDDHNENDDRNEDCYHEPLSLPSGKLTWKSTIIILIGKPPLSGGFSTSLIIVHGSSQANLQIFHH